MVSAAEQRSYWVAYIETIPGYPCCSFTASPLIPWKAKRQMEQGNEVESCYTELSTHHLLSDQIKVGHSEFGSKVVLFVCFYFIALKHHLLNSTIGCSFEGQENSQWFVTMAEISEEKWQDVGFSAFTLNGWGGGVRRLWATDPSVKLLIEEKIPLFISSDGTVPTEIWLLVH